MKPRAPLEKIPRFYIPPSAVGEKQIQLTDWVVRHAIHALRLSAGGKVIIFDGEGHEFLVTLVRDEKNNYIGKIEEKLPGGPELNVKLRLYQGPLQTSRWEWLLEKAAELGVSTITPLLTQFGEDGFRQISSGKQKRWGKIIQSACEQCGRSVVPKLHSPLPFQEAVKTAPGNKFLFYEVHTAGIPLRKIIPKIETLKEISIFIGPKGGFSKEEIKLAQSFKIPIVSLGKLTFRAETAAIAALAMLSLLPD